MLHLGCPSAVQFQNNDVSEAASRASLMRRRRHWSAATDSTGTVSVGKMTEPWVETVLQVAFMVVLCFEGQQLVIKNRLCPYSPFKHERK